MEAEGLQRTRTALEGPLTSGGGTHVAVKASAWRAASASSRLREAASASID